MSTIPELDSIRCPLEGANLIEAAAGTGKTHNIQNLAVRLLVEKGIPIDRILVVTFTEAATAELKERIRNILAAMLKAATAPEDAPLRERELLEHARNEGVPPELCIQRLRTALRRFDENAISTIHGFCFKLLTENAFESGVLFTGKLIGDTAELITELGRDFYRKTFYSTSGNALFSALWEYAPARLEFDELMLPAREKLRRPLLEFCIAPDAPRSGEQAQARLRLRLDRIRAQRSTANFALLDGNVNKIDSMGIAECITGARHFLEEGELSGATLRAMTALTPEKIRTAISRTGSKAAKEARPALIEELLAASPLYGQFDALLREIWEFHVALQLEAAAFVSCEFEKRKQRDNFQTFDDLLLRARDAIAAPDSPLLARLREHYRAGIIDEFQDTDPVQYRIFSEIFRNNGIFFMVGDPRQAIYAFRGGDIETYRRAVRELERSGGRKYTLRRNYRSAAAMIAAVNRIFADGSTPETAPGHRFPFADPDITFPAVIPGEDEEGRTRSALLVNGREEANPLRIVPLPGHTKDEMPRRTARMVLDMLSDAALRIPPDPKRNTPERQVTPGDIAILVFDHRLGELTATELRKLGIPAVFTGLGNVYESDDAAELLTMLRAVAEPTQSNRITEALATRIGGVALPRLLELRRPENELELARLQEHFPELLKLWQKESFIGLFGSMLNRFQVLERYPALEAGERHLTNLLQLGDLLQKESVRRALSPSGTIQFLARQIENSGRDGTEEAELLLETDRKAVKISTIHASKGLEYPIVLLPALNARDAETGAPGRLDAGHNAAGDLEYDPLRSPETLLRASTEKLQELLRIAYVAITRAQYRCVLCYPRSRSSRTALDWLFRLRDPDRNAPLPPQTASAPEALIPAEFLEPLPEFPELLRYAPSDADLPQLECPEPHLAINRFWRYASYSTLTPESGTDTPFDYEEHVADQEEPLADSDSGIFAIRGGAAAGNAWHKILELVDFNAPPERIAKLAFPLLAQYGIIRGGDPETHPHAVASCRMVELLLRAPLCGSDGVAFTLSEIPRAKRLSELEFLYSFRSPGFGSADLRRILEPWAAEKFGMADWPRWERTIRGGCLNGIIDLVFEHHGKYFILDWKSNRLGGVQSNFSPEMLRIPMARNFYFLQYLIYTVALVKFLRSRQGNFGRAEYEARFGGVFYLFLRGVSPEAPGRGIFYDLPDYSLIEQLEAIIG